MATWKKVIVSGSSANLANIQVDGLTQDQVVIGGGSGNLTTTAINGTGNIVATTNATNLDHSGSFSGSFEGDGSGLTGVIATVSNPLSDGPGIYDFSYDGSSAGVTVSVDSGSLAGDGLDAPTAGGFAVQPDSTTGGDTQPVTVGGNGVGFDVSAIAGDALSTDGDGVIDVDVDGSTIEIDGTSLGVVDGGIGTAQIADSLGNINENSFTGSFSGSFSGDVDINLEDLTAGAGLNGTAYDGNSPITFSVDSGSFAGTGLGADDTGLIVNVDDTTIEVDTDALKVKDGGITATQLNSSVAGDGLAGGGGTALSVNVDDSTIEITTDTLNVKAGGITTTEIADSLGNINENSFTGSFSGSFIGDGSGLSGLATTLNITDGVTPQAIDLQSENLTFASANANEITVDTTTADTVTIGLPDDVTITNDLTVSRNLTVQGTASFQNTENLLVADRFVLFASGSNTTGDGGIVIQQATQDEGELFGFDSGTTRWAVDSAFDASTSAFTPEAFMAAVVEGADADPDNAPARYDKKGNIFVGTDESIFIYS